MSSNTLGKDLQQLVAGMVTAGIHYHEGMKIFRRQYLIENLERQRGNVCRAAASLGEHRNTLMRQLDELDINARQFRPKPVTRATAANLRQMA